MAALIPALILGGLLGCLVNYLADVLPRARRFTQPTCPSCDHPFSLSDYLSGRSCPQCGRSRGLRFWGVVITLAAASALAWMNPPARIGFALGLILLGYLATVFVIDMEHRLILHPTSIFGAVLALALGWMSHGITATLLGGLGGFVIMLVLYSFGWLFTRLRTRRMQAEGQSPDDEEALGQGDVILAAVLGLLLGWPLIWFGLLLGILFGGAFGIILVVSALIKRRYRNQALMLFMPYGPFFILSAFLLIFLPGWASYLVPK